jgi:hypothetical protein
MAYTPEKTWTSVTLPASDLNTYVRDNVTYLYDEWAKRHVLDAVFSNTEVVNTTTPTDIWTYTLAANVLGSGNAVIGEIVLSCLQNNSSPSTTLAIAPYYSTGTVAASVSLLIGATRTIHKVCFTLKGNGATNSQILTLHCSAQDTNGAGQTLIRSTENTLTIDSTSNQTLSLRVTWGAAHANISAICRSAILLYQAAV